MKLLSYTIFTGIFLSASAFATPGSISYSGRLTDSSGKPLQGTVDLQVDFYRSETGSDIINVVIPPFANVTLNEGIFQIQLDLSNADLHTIFNGKDPVWIQITNLTNNRSYPRQTFSATPHALKIPVDDKLVEFNSQGKLTLKAGPADPGKFLKADGNGDLTWDNIPGGGDMLGSNNLSEVADQADARNNLGLGTLATKSNVVSADITDGTIADADISNSANIDGTKINPDFGNRNLVTTGSVTAGSFVGDGSGLTNIPSASLGSSIDSSEIVDGTIVNDDISASANIATSKLSGAITSITNHGLGSLAEKSAIASGDITDGEVKADDIASGAIADTHVAANAAIATSKLSGSVTDIANHGLGTLASKSAIASGDITDGEVTADDIASGAIANTHVASNAAIAGSKVNPDFGTQHIKTTGMVQMGNPGTACSSSLAGSIRYDSTTKRLESCLTFDGGNTWTFGPIVTAITSSLTLTATANDCTSIQSLMDSLYGIAIGKDAVVTISIPDGTYNCASNLHMFGYPYGHRINIIGNTTTPSNVTLNFTGTNGFSFVSQGLGLLNGIRVIGSDAANGIFAKRANVTLGSKIDISHFYTAINITDNSSVEVLDTTVTDYLTITSVNSGITANNSTYIGQYTRATGNGTASGSGFLALNRAYLEVSNAQASNFSQGFVAQSSSRVTASEAVADANTTGFNAQAASSLSATSATSSNNTNGFAAGYASYILANNSTASNNTTGYSAFNTAHIYATGSTATGNTTAYSPAINTESNTNAYITK